MSQKAMAESASAGWSTFANPAAAGKLRLAFWLVALLATVPLLIEYLIGLLQIDHYHYVPLAIVAVAGLAWTRSNRAVYLPRSLFAWLPVLFGLVLLLIAIYLNSPWIGAASFVVIAAAWLATAREPDGRSLIGLALPLLMILRLPLGIDAELIIRLQRWTTRLASYLLDLIRIPHFTNGNVIGLSGRELFVAEACSGIQSVFTLLFLASLWVAYRRYPLWHAPIYWAVAIMAAILGNAVRVGIVAVADVWLGVDWATGTSHELVGYFALILATLLLLSFDQLFRTWFHPILPEIPDNRYRDDRLVRFWDNWVTGVVPPPSMQPDEEEEEELDPDASAGVAAGWGMRSGPRAAWTPPVRLVWAQVYVATALCLFSVLLVVSTAVANVRKGGDQRAYESFVPSDRVMGERVGKLAVIEHEIARDGEEKRLGLEADIWKIGDDRLHGQIILSQPYFGWHELCVCYENIDWRLVDRAVLSAGNSPSGSGSSPSDVAGSAAGGEYALARFRNRDDRYGYLWFSAVTYDGVDVAPPPGLGTISRLGRRFNNETVYDGELMMLQLWVDSPTRLEPDDLQTFRDSFEQARAKIMREVAASSDAEEPSGLPDAFPADDEANMLDSSGNEAGVSE